MVWTISAPLRRLFGRVLARVGEIIRSFLVWLVKKMVPIVVRMHSYGVFEAVAHFAALTLFAQV